METNNNSNNLYRLTSLYHNITTMNILNNRQIYDSNKKPLIFVITGQAHSGKDTFYHFASEELKKRGIIIEQGSFAGFLKILCRDWIRIFYSLDLPLSHFDDPVEKEREYSEYQFNGRPLKIRNVLQYMGTEVFRDQISSTFWVEQLYKRQIEKSNADIFFITDCRFPNEIEYLQSMNCNLFVLKIVRSNVDGIRGDENNLSIVNQQHKSEQSMNEIKYDYLFENSCQSIQEYKNHIIEWIQSFINKSSPICPMFLHMNYII